MENSLLQKNFEYCQMQTSKKLKELLVRYNINLRGSLSTKVDMCNALAAHHSFDYRQLDESFIYNRPEFRNSKYNPSTINYPVQIKGITLPLPEKIPIPKSKKYAKRTTPLKREFILPEPLIQSGLPLLIPLTFPIPPRLSPPIFSPPRLSPSRLSPPRLSPSRLSPSRNRSLRNSDQVFDCNGFSYKQFQQLMRDYDIPGRNKITTKDKMCEALNFYVGSGIF